MKRSQHRWPRITNPDDPRVKAEIARIQALWESVWSSAAPRDRWPLGDAAVAALPDLTAFYTCPPEMRESILTCLREHGAQIDI